MRLAYFIDYRYDEQADRFLPIGIWIQDQDDPDGVDIYYPEEESSDEYWEAMWVINRLVEEDLKAPPDFLEFHRQRAGYKGMRSKIFEETTDLSVDEFMRRTLQRFVKQEGK